MSKDVSNIVEIFIYELLSEHLPAGKVEGIVNAIENAPYFALPQNALGQYAVDLSNRLSSARTKQLRDGLDGLFAREVEGVITSDIGLARLKQMKSQIEAAEQVKEKHFGDDTEELQYLKNLVDSALERADEEEVKKNEAILSADNGEGLVRTEGVVEGTPGFQDKISLMRQNMARNQVKPAADDVGEVELEDDVDMGSAQAGVSDDVGSNADDSEERPKVGYLSIDPGWEKNQQVNSAVNALDQIKELFPTDEVKGIVDVLKGQIESDLNPEIKTLDTEGKMDYVDLDEKGLGVDEVWGKDVSYGPIDQDDSKKIKVQKPIQKGGKMSRGDLKYLVDGE